MDYITPKSALVAHTVLVTALDAVENPAGRETALELIRESYDLGLRDKSIEQRLIRGAQAKILGERVWEDNFIPAAKPTDRATFEMMAKAWLVWASGGDPMPVLNNVLKSNEYGGALHLMALEPWGRAIKALKLEEWPEAARGFRRSMELGAQYGFESSDAISWSYVASFFHRGT
jgi:hypothetical protein